MPTKDVRGTARGDFDGDGRYDTVTIYDPVGPPQLLLDEEPLAHARPTERFVDTLADSAEDPRWNRR